MPKFIQDLIHAFGSYIFLGCLMVGLIPAFAATMVVDSFVGAAKPTRIYSILLYGPNPNSYLFTWLGLGFIVLWLLIAVCTYLAIEKQLDSIYSRLHRQQNEFFEDGCQ